MERDYILAPSFPAPSWEALERVLLALRGVTREFQVDFVDGQFATPTSWPFNSAHGLDDLARLLPYSKDFILEADLMCQAPEQYFDRLLAAGFSRIIVHYGSTEAWEEIIAHHQARSYRLGLACTNDTYKAAEVLLPHFDFVQVMGIARVGEQGQPFDERTLETVAELRLLDDERTIAIDGAVNEDTITKLKEAGANRFAPGSAITQSPDPVAAYKQLQSLLS